MDGLESKLIGVTMPQKQYDELVSKLKPLQTVQDIIREIITEYLEKNCKLEA